MAGIVVRVAKPLYLCEEVDTEGGMVNLYGLTNSIRAPEFPHVAQDFCVFAQLNQGLGDVPFYFDIRRAADGYLVHTSEVNGVRFPSRAVVRQVLMRFRDIWFDAAGLHVVELFCNNAWVADVTFQLREDR